jgi:hypothetical protein
MLIRKAWHQYPDAERAALIRAYLAPPHALAFDFEAWARSARSRLQWMQADIRRQGEAPADLRAAAEAVKWGNPEPTAKGWQIVGAIRKRPLPGQIEAAIASQTVPERGTE